MRSWWPNYPINLDRDVKTKQKPEKKRKENPCCSALWYRVAKINISFHFISFVCLLCELIDGYLLIWSYCTLPILYIGIAFNLFICF